MTTLETLRFLLRTVIQSAIRRRRITAVAASPVILVLTLMALLRSGPEAPPAQAQAIPSRRPVLPPRVPGQPRPGDAPGGVAPRNPSAGDFLRVNPFQLAPQDVPPEDQTPKLPSPPPPPPTPGVDPASKLTLLGTYIRGRDRTAVIRREKESDVYTIGDSPVEGAQVVDIQPQQVVLQVDGRRLVLEMNFGEWKPISGDAGGGGPDEPGQAKFETGGSAEGVARKLPRAEVDQYLDNLNTVLTQINVQQNFQNGQPAGFRLSNIQRGSVLSQIGVQNGDVLRFVNGQRIDSVQSAFQLYNILKESTNVEVTVLRDTRPVVLRYIIY